LASIRTDTIFNYFYFASQTQTVENSFLKCKPKPIAQHFTKQRSDKTNDVSTHRIHLDSSLRLHSTCWKISTQAKGESHLCKRNPMSLIFSALAQMISNKTTTLELEQFE